MPTIALERPRRALGVRVTEATVFTAATGVAALHALDDAFLHRQPGVGLGQHALAAALALAGAAAAIYAFPRVRPSARALIAFLFAVLATVNGAMHVQHVRVDRLAESDLTGILAAAAGVVLAGLAVAVLWRHRRPGSRKVWAQRVLAVPALLTACFLVVGPSAMGIVEVHKWREPIGPPPGAGYEDAAFRASDGLKLTGWYHPSANGAAVLLVHGGNGDRQGAARHARMLVRHGYGVLLYDSRGRGHSEGSTNGYGWDWDHDVDGAIAYLERRPDVEPGRIGALGLSTGADVIVAAAPDHPELKAVVADGTAAGGYEDWHRLRGDEAGVIPGLALFGTIRVLSGEPAPPALQDRLAEIRRPTLLVSTGTAEEAEFGELYARVDNPAVDVWQLPEAGHTAALRQFPALYERRVTDLFDRALR
jgi:hypothetical protein